MLNDEEKKSSKQQIKSNKVNKKNSKKKEDGFLRGFLNTSKGNKKKQNKKKQKKTKKKAQNTPNDQNEPKAVSEPKQDNKPNPKSSEKMEEAKEANVRQIGYHLIPSDIEATKDCEGNIFLCINPRKSTADLSGYKLIKCWVSFKHKLKKKQPKKKNYFAVLLDFRNQTKSEREFERERLKNGFENVLSFTFSNIYEINDVSEDKERRITLNKAFSEYQENGILRNAKFDQIELEKKKKQKEEKKKNTKSPKNEKAKSSKSNSPKN